MQREYLAQKFMDSSNNDREQLKGETLDVSTDLKEPDWSKLRSADINRLVERHHRWEDLTTEEHLILGRFERFERSWRFRLHPCNDNTDLLREAFLDVMTRLSSEVFEYLSSKMRIVWLPASYRALNVPVPPAQDVIVFLDDQFQKLSPQARIGLVAHELAHSCVEKPQHSENEAAADDLVKSWGFSQELGALRNG
jgi:hypothetical protein